MNLRANCLWEQTWVFCSVIGNCVGGLCCFSNYLQRAECFNYAIRLSWAFNFVPFQFLFGSAHILKQPPFHHACEAAFRECDGDGKSYILKQEVWICSNDLLPCLTFFIFPQNFLSLFFFQLQNAVSQSIPNMNLDEVSVMYCYKFHSPISIWRELNMHWLINGNNNSRKTVIFVR